MPSTPSTTAPSIGQRALAVGGVLLLGMAVYGRCLGFGFVQDDRLLVEGSRLLPEVGTLKQALVHDLFWLAEGKARVSPYWRPLVSASYYLDQAVGGGQPWAFHLHNLLLVLLAGGAAAWRFGLRGAMAAGLVLLHPMSVEAIANITARTDLHVALWGSLAVLTAGPWAALFTLLALFSKETAVVVPLIAWLAAPRGPGGRRQWLPPLLALLAWALVRSALVHSWAVDTADAGHPTLQSALTAPAMLLFYAQRLVLPFWPTVARLPPDFPVWAGLLALFPLGRGLWLARDWPPALRRDAALVLLPLLPVSGLLASPVRYAEGFLFWPVVGLAALSLRLSRSRQPWLGGLLLALSAITVARVPDWQSPLTLWSSAVAAHPTDPRAALGLARVVADADPDRALLLAERAAETEPHPRRRREALALVAKLRLDRGDPEGAAAALREAADPADAEATWALVARCVLRADQDPVAELIAVCDTALHRSPRDPDLWNAAGILSTRQKDWVQAKDRFAEAARLAPERAEFASNLAKVEGILGAAGD